MYIYIYIESNTFIIRSYISVSSKPSKEVSYIYIYIYIYEKPSLKQRIIIYSVRRRK